MTATTKARWPYAFDFPRVRIQSKVENAMYAMGWRASQFALSSKPRKGVPVSTVRILDRYGYRFKVKY